MELDKRFKVLPFCCFGTDKRVITNHIGKKGYFANTISYFSDINLCKYGTLGCILDESKPEEPFYMEENKLSYGYFIPECFVKPKEKNYRPYTLNEFLDKYSVCANIRIRQRDRACQYFGKLIGYEFPTDPNTGKQKGDNDAIVCIGGYNFKLIDLFTDYEQYDNMKDIWVPCGVEVKE